LSNYKPNDEDMEGEEKDRQVRAPICREQEVQPKVEKRTRKIEGYPVRSEGLTCWSAHGWLEVCLYGESVAMKIEVAVNRYKYFDV
jgi:hypothetical protein